MSILPVMRPKLPVAARLADYLGRIDEARLYSNFGPLVVGLEQRLAAHYGLDTGTVTTVANATVGLTLALMTQNAKVGGLCVMPAWTFVASAHAALTAGLIPYFIDVDPHTWSLDPQTVAQQVAAAPGVVGAVMPVAAFGRQLDVAAWDRFASQTGIPVVIDAAAGFDTVLPGKTPSVVSLHATKVLGTGEGGFVVCTDRSIVGRIRSNSNFGLSSSRQATQPATNAKMSEYHAAVGHAALDEWSHARSEWMAVARAYRDSFENSNHIRLQTGFGATWVSSTCVLSAADGAAPRIERLLQANGIETRHWWGKGAHAHPATAHYPRTSLPVTEALANSTIAIPHYRDLGDDDIARIAALVVAA